MCAHRLHLRYRAYKISPQQYTQHSDHVQRSALSNIEDIHYFMSKKPRQSSTIQTTSGDSGLAGLDQDLLLCVQLWRITPPEYNIVYRTSSPQALCRVSSMIPQPITRACICAADPLFQYKKRTISAIKRHGQHFIHVIYSIGSGNGTCISVFTIPPTPLSPCHSPLQQPERFRARRTSC